MEHWDISHRKPVVLVVDDDENDRNLARHYLSKSGIVIETATDGRRVLSQIRERVPDLVLLDVLMPGLDGFETCAELRQMPRCKTPSCFNDYGSR